MLFACSGDRGLCGAIHSSVAKLAKRCAAESPGAQIVVLGDKAKPQVARGARHSIALSFSHLGKDIPNFADAVAICLAAQDTLRTAPAILLVHNAFKSVIAYEPTLVPVPTVAQLAAAPGLAAYECADPAVLDALAHFLLAARLFSALVEGHAAEMAAKRMAMENASKNSDDIVARLTMQYNRTRQSVITNELVDIITGASAL